MIKKKGTLSKQNILKILATIGLSLIALTMTLPFLWMLSASFKVEVDVFKFPVEWIPRKWNIINNYMEVWSGRYSFPLFYFNSIKVTVLTTIVQVTVSAMGAYAFSKIRFKFRDALFLIYLSMMMIPDQVTIVPKFLVLKWLSLFDTHRGLILLGSFSVYGMFLLKQYMMTIPDSLSESARIDGAGHAKTFLKIILPMTKPALVTLMMLKFVWTWNDFQNPLVFIQSEELYTIQLGMTKFMTEYNSFYSLIMVAAVCSIIPLLIVFLIGQRYILEGMTMGAVKG
ncbi:MAG TPA: carbohydrate ABC transporter permease [Clostridia bacterium]|nr:carbohydrate ABC transporter permease [Clostridia bacterium]